ncbi:MAG: SRPBCC family protein [Cyanobacteria bacterium P01_D01_bin.115]
MKTVKFALLLTVSSVILSACSGLKSDPDIGLSPNTHNLESVNVRDFTEAPLRAEVKVFLPIPPEEAMEIVADFENYSNWVVPPPEKVEVDNSETSEGGFGVGTKVSYKEGESDIIEYYDESLAMIARPLWGLDNFEGHRGVVLVSKHENGSIMHMRRYFDTKGPKGWFMSQMMPIFMEKSAKNLAEKHNGEVL